MGGKKRADSDKLIDKTFGKAKDGKGKITEAWQRILQEQDHDFRELNELLKTSELFTETGEQQGRDKDSDFIDFYTDSKEGFQLSKAESLSIHSIQPGPITLNSDLKEISNESDFAVKNPIPKKLLLLSTCCLPAKSVEEFRYHEAEKNIQKCDEKISQYFHRLKICFTSLEALLKFSCSTAAGNLPKVINLASAQLWFVTFALAREMTHSDQLDRSSTLFFRRKYQILLSYAQRMSTDANILAILLSRIVEKGMKQIHAMKQALTGSSMTDLANSEITPYDNVFVEGTSWTELTQHLPHHVNQFNPRHSRNLPPSISYLFQNLDKPDSLSERRQLEIFVKNVTKSGWTNYEGTFTLDNRMKLLSTLLSETLGVIAQTIGLCSKVKKRLTAATNSKCHAKLSCGSTLLPWFRDAKNCVTYCVKTTIFGPTEYEFLRFYVYASEMRLKALFRRAAHMNANVRDISEVATLSCDLMEKKFELMIPNYAEIRSVIKFENKEKAVVNCDSSVSAFYLNGYANVLKQAPISFRISRFILSKKILIQERHSGVDFGVRFFSTSESYAEDED